MVKNAKSIEFSRTHARLDDREMWEDADKWSVFLDLISRSKGTAEILVLDRPEVLGDTYREIIVNLMAIADAGLKIEIRPSGKVKEESLSYKDPKGGTITKSIFGS